MHLETRLTGSKGSCAGVDNPLNKGGDFMANSEFYQLLEGQYEMNRPALAAAATRALNRKIQLGLGPKDGRDPLLEGGPEGHVHFQGARRLIDIIDNPNRV
ncbi:hypothetical protein A2685_02525 [Candidatus Woesebacteria bacterium RIFCSPHIGHO2_01_FULL_37_10]|uniref:Uncharacterized protein n=1 Tax=Candidatus Woesebacteria bacterium RIFCSPHIGHO2_01_FULL_37_10 TaxID=1802489 RepID=A0A1F7XU84_9BACT|nr:MAG: hypothetical protein A2685_02525 [Candidatus Woesebacteria bacterium RIFCSPHIGHO2_01_FULL_37_10]